MWNIRSFFRERNILEVETPILSRASGLDPWIDVFQTENFVDGVEASHKTPLYMNTSPEYHMKRLLAQGYPDIFQICKAFRNGETGPKHQWEFSILEWYRLGWTDKELRQEVIDLVQLFGFTGEVRTWTWRELYQSKLGFDPVEVCTSELAQICLKHNIPDLTFNSHESQFEMKEAYLDYLLVSLIEPKLGWEGPEWIIDYPAHQAALARTWIDSEGNHWAHRFELYIEGVELCNGYWELTDSQEQERRFDTDQEKRRLLNKRTLEKDQRFLDAMKQGIPDCSGVALGLDRLIMLALNQKEIQSVLCFNNENC